MAERGGPRAPAIEEHGLIGDGGTAALVATDATIDFLCFPRFDSPTVFAALLDPDRGGAFRLTPDLPGARRRQAYLPETAILHTRFLAPDGVAEVIDFLDGDGGPTLVRLVRTVRGEVRYAARCAPRFDYGRAPHSATIADGAATFAAEGQEGLRLAASIPLELDGGDAIAGFTLGAGETAAFLLGRADAPAADASAFARAAQDRTLAHWRRWTARSSYAGRWREAVARSAITLKLLTCRHNGSVVAAPTFGLPEDVGGARNWDYRYTWIRDAAFTMYAFIRLGYAEEAHAFTRWVEARLEACPGEAANDGPLRIMYTLAGEAVPDETELDFAGWRDSRPVRVGNGANDQFQLDIYGEMMDAAYLAIKHGDPPSFDAWAGFRRVTDWVCDNWERPDAGIWEIRGEPQSFLHSRVMCWVAIDRAVRLATKLSLPAPFPRWVEARAAIRADVIENFWNAEERTFVQARGGRAVDASALLMPLVRFISPTDPRWLSTLDAIGRHLVQHPLVRRYAIGTERAGADDGLPGDEAAFTTCSFWYAECLARAGRVEEARLIFEEVLGYANHLGLFAEELGPSGEHLGNFPQALTHLALISAATYLDRKLSGRVREPWSA